jgi:CubicO group peptidase (beta-lactamase class C family)
MKKFFFQPLTALSVFIVLVFGQVQATAQGFSTQDQSRLQSVLDSFQNYSSQPFIGGISAAIKIDGLASWKGATGYAARNYDAQNNLLPGGTAFATSTLSRMYSVTKTFTAALVLELEKEGTLNLSLPVSAILPLNLINPGLNGSVTIRQLLAHESGYSDYTGELGFQMAVAFQPTHIWTPFEVASFVHQENAPGTIRKYSSTNYILLGAIVEAVTSQSVEQHFRTRFISPLALNSMYFAIREPQPAGTMLASPHDNLSPFNPIFQFTGQPLFPNAYTNVSAFPFVGIVSAAFTGGAMVSTAEDMANWGNAIFTGKATSSGTLDAMINSISSNPDAQGDYLGYGIWKSTKMSTMETFIGHDGNAPGYRSVMFFQPDKKITIAVLTNFGGADIYAIAKALYAVIPSFTCPNQENTENKIKLCFNGQTVCVAPAAATVLVNKGAVLGACSITTVARSKEVAPASLIMEEQREWLLINNGAGKLLLTCNQEIGEPVTLDLFDMNGKMLMHLYKGKMQKDAVHQIMVSQHRLASGVYVAALKTRTGVSTQKISLMK